MPSSLNSTCALKPATNRGGARSASGRERSAINLDDERYERSITAYRRNPWGYPTPLRDTGASSTRAFPIMDLMHMPTVADFNEPQSGFSPSDLRATRLKRERSARRIQKNWRASRTRRGLKQSKAKRKKITGARQRRTKPMYIAVHW